jgi:hypothetical protein
MLTREEIIRKSTWVGMANINNPNTDHPGIDVLAANASMQKNRASPPMDISH